MVTIPEFSKKSSKRLQHPDYGALEIPGLRIPDQEGVIGRLVKVPGIGRKTAERLLLELKGKLGDGVSGIAINRPRPVASDVMTALLALGYSDREAQLAVKQLPEGLSVSESIRQALKSLARG